MTSTVKSIPLSTVTTYERCQIRLRENRALIRLYADQMRNGERFPPLTVARIGSQLVIVDGLHRLAANQLLKRKFIRVKFIDLAGELLVTTALKLNTAHGQSLSRKDRHAAILKLREENVNASNRELAKLLGVNERTVRRVLAQAQFPHHQVDRTSKNVTPSSDSFEKQLIEITTSLSKLLKKFPENRVQISKSMLGVLVTPELKNTENSNKNISHLNL